MVLGWEDNLFASRLSCGIVLGWRPDAIWHVRWLT